MSTSKKSKDKPIKYSDIPTKATDKPLTRAERKQKNLIDFGANPLTREDVERVLSVYATTETPLLEICNTYQIPYDMFWSVVSSQSKYKGLVEHARKSRAAILADKVMTVADDKEAHPAHNKNRMSARQWLAKCYDRRTYGDKVEVDQRSVNVQVYLPSKKGQDS